MTQDEDVKRWILGSDEVLVRAVAVAVGEEARTALVAHLKDREEWLSAAKVMWAAPTKNYLDLLPKAYAVVSVLREHVDLTTREGRQLELKAYSAKAAAEFDLDEQKRVRERVIELLDDDNALHVAPDVLFCLTIWHETCRALRVLPVHW